MEIPLNLSRHRQQEFLDYLNAALRSRLSMYSGSAGQDKEGRFFSEVGGRFQVDDGHADLNWRLEWGEQGLLERLIVAPADSSVVHPGWAAASYEFAASVLAATL